MIEDLSYPYNIVAIILFLIVCWFCTFNKESIGEWIRLHRKGLNLFLIISFSLIIICTTIYYVNDNSPSDPPNDKLLVAISPFYYIDESGYIGSDIITTNDFKSRLDEDKDLNLDVMVLDKSVNNEYDAKSVGKLNGAHIVIYGETKSKIGNVDEIEYHILPLLSLNISTSEVQSLEYGIKSYKSEKVTLSVIPDETVTITESLTENATSYIYIIGAFENYKRLNFIEAIEFFKSVKGYETNPLILFYIANCYYFENNFNASLQYYDKAIDINPQFSEAWYNKGGSLTDLKIYEDAIESYNSAINISPNYSEAWNNKGHVLGKLGRHEDAIAAYDRTTNINPKHSNAWYNRGNALNNLGKYEKAIESYDIAIDINPQHAEARINRGNILYFLGRSEEAIMEYDNATGINPPYADAWYNKGIVLSNLSRYGEALVAFNKAININTDHAGAWNNKGNVLYLLDRYEEALISYNMSIELDSQAAEALRNKGVVLSALERYEEAISMYDKSLNIDSQSAKAWNNKGGTLYLLGRYEEAVAAYDKAIEIDSQYAEARNNKEIAQSKV